MTRAATIILTLLLLFSCPLRGEEGKSYRLRMLWLPQAEFAGFYRAVADGLYRKAGVNVIIEHPRPEEEIFDTLRDGHCDLIVAWPIPAVKRAAQGDDLVNVCQISQDSALMLIARKESGITKPQDISGHRVGLWVPWSLQAPFLAFFKHYGVHDYDVLPVLVNVDLFLYRGVDVTVGVYYDEYYRLFSAGFDQSDLVCFDLNDAFPRLVDDGLYCRRETYEKDPAAIARIREATLAGWRAAVNDPEGTLKLVKAECNKAGTPFNIAHQRWMLSVMGNQIFPKGKTNHGLLGRETFDEVIRMLGLDSSLLSYERFVPRTNEVVR